MAEENIGLFKHVQIDTDGITVWVNTEAGCIARFGRQGIDIHQVRWLAELNVNKHGPNVLDECLYCTHAPTTKTDWHTFVAKMLELYRFKVPEKYMPRRFRG
jgi:hypothetical protein